MSIRALFTEDAVYRYDPDDREPLNRRQRRSSRALAEESGTPTESTSSSGTSSPDGLEVVQGVTTYDDGKRRAVYDNLFVIDLAEDGRAARIHRVVPGRDATPMPLKNWVTRYRAAWESNDAERHPRTASPRTASITRRLRTRAGPATTRS